jgi:hypothetical protein
VLINAFYREKDRLGLAGQKQVQGDLCYGQQALDKIAKWEGPTAVGDSNEATIFYTYKIGDLAEWAKNPGIQRVFPGIVSTINRAGKIQNESGADPDRSRMGSQGTRYSPLEWASSVGRQAFFVDFSEFS